MRKKVLSLVVLMVFLLSFVTACSKPNQNTVNGKQEQTNQTVSKEQKDDQDDGDTNDDKYDNKDDDKNNNKDSKDDDKKDNKKDQDNDQDDDKNNQNSKDDKNDDSKNTKDDKNDNDDKSDDSLIDEDGHYTSKDEVALYIHTYGKLPNNYITKGEAKKLGWDSKKGNLFEVTDGKSIGGDKFSNREGKLPKEDGRKWYECDIDYDGGHRGAKRIVYSNDGLIYYTDDHYETFTLLYEGE